MSYSKVLKQRYNQNRFGITFQDGVSYSNSELDELNKISGSDALAEIHEIKKLFHGRVRLIID